MNPIFLLKELGLLEQCKTALDVGTRDGRIAAHLVQSGLVVEAIDINELTAPLPGVIFTQISVEDFLKENTKHYDLVVARHVLHHVSDPKAVIQDLADIADILFFTCFGPQDEWAGKVSTLSHEEVMGLFRVEQVRHHSEAFQYGKTYAGDMKFWHINTFVIDNRI